MSRSQMQQARQLIDQKRYDEARAILKKIDDPRARDWLKKLDKLAPPKRRGSGSPLRTLLGYLLAIILSAAVTIGLLAALVIVTASSRGSARVQAVENAKATMVAENATATPTPDLRTGRVISNQNINVRSEPNTGSTAVAALVPGTEVVVLGETDDGSWYNIQFSNGRTGWVAAQLLDAEPAPTAVAGAVEDTPTPEATPTPEQACTPEEAQSWFDANRWSIYKIDFAVYQLSADQPPNVKVDYQRLADLVQKNTAVFEQADHPPCIDAVRNTYLEGYRTLASSLESYSRGDTNRGRDELNNVKSRLDPANAVLTDQLGVDITLTDCEAEIWYAGLADDINTYFAIIEGVTATTGPSNEIRSTVFDLQELRRTSEVAYPECATEANNHLLAGMDAAVKLFQAIMSEDAASVQTELTTVANERTAFLHQLQQFGIPLIQEPAETG